MSRLILQIGGGLAIAWGIDSYTTDNSNTLGAGGVYKLQWQKGMYSENSYSLQISFYQFDDKLC